MSGSGWKIVVSLIDIIAFGVALAPDALRAYENARRVINKVIDENREPTMEEHDAINEWLNMKRAELHRPLPTIEGGTE